MDAFEQKFLRTVKKHALFQPGDHIILGLSGGADSLALFSLLTRFCPERMPVTVHPVHVNHKIRKGEADEDQRFVEELCCKEGLRCRSVMFDCVKEARRLHLTEEEAGRNKRYQVFDDAARELEREGISRSRIKIATAHHADDQVETVLLHLLRGSGTDGLSGMAYCRTDACGFTIIRPLLDCWKQEIREYDAEEGLEPREDQTNSDPSYGRNRIRLELIPYLQRYNPKIKDALIRLTESVREDRAYLDAQAEQQYQNLASVNDQSGQEKAVILRRDEAEALPGALRMRVLKHAVVDAGLTEDFTASHLQAADHVLCGKNPSARTELPHGFSVWRDYGNVLIGRTDTYRTSAKGDVHADRPGASIRTVMREELPKDPPKGTCAYFDAEKLEAVYGSGADQQVCWRTWRPGDYIAIPGGRKKLQDVMVDDKVPKDERDRICMAAVGSEVLFLPAWDEKRGRARYSSLYVVGPDTKKAVLVEINCLI